MSINAGCWYPVMTECAASAPFPSASRETMEEIEELANSHHPEMKMDIIRAYHFGQNLLVSA